MKRFDLILWNQSLGEFVFITYSVDIWCALFEAASIHPDCIIKSGKES